jgi:hypothetical protein
VIPNRQRDFPNLQDSDFYKTSDETDSYNCIAWAAGDDQRWWQAEPFQQYYWPGRLTEWEDVQALVSIYEGLGFVQCHDGSAEPGWEKIAVYADAKSEWTHAARQLSDGQWTSKLGVGIDITHKTPEVLVGPAYGTLVRFLKKPSP